MKIIKHIPNTITSMNLFSGAIGVILVLNHQYEYAFYAMILAAVFDFFDGLVARLLKVSSEIGKELDSLADMISFGLLPALFLFKFYESSMPSYSAPLASWGAYLRYFPLIIAVFSALRLAKFNLDTRQHSSFLGLPTPANALLIASFVLYFSRHNFPCETGLSYLILLMSFVLSLLLVCEIPMFGMKFAAHGSQKAEMLKRITFLAIVAVFTFVVLFLGYHWSLIILLSFTMYIISNLIFWLVRKF